MRSEAKMESVEEQIKEFKTISNKIELLITENKTEEAEQLLENYSSVMQNSTIYSYKAILAYLQGDAEKGIAVLKDGVKEHPFSFSLYFNLGFIYGVLQKYEDSLMNYLYAVKYSLSEKEKQEALDGFQESVNISVQEGFYTTQEIKDKVKGIEKDIHQHDARVYPIDTRGVSMIRKPLGPLFYRFKK